MKVFPVIISYWTTSIPTAALMTIYLVVVFAFHLMPNSWFAEFEFCTGAVKVTTMAIVLLTSVAIIAGAGPTGSTQWGANFNELPVFPNGFRVSPRPLTQDSQSLTRDRVLLEPFSTHRGPLEVKKSWA
jgi:amino acid permease